MPWYFNNSETTTSVEIGNEEVVSVFPRDYVFIDSSASSKIEVSRLVSRGILQRTGKPSRGEKRVPRAKVVSAENTATQFSKAVIESESPKVEESDALAVEDKVETAEKTRQVRRKRKQ